MSKTYLAFLSLNQQQEEQLEDETVEQFEERVRNKRSNVLLMYLSNQLEEHQTISFQRLVKDNRRKQVCFLLECRAYFY